MAPPPVKTQLAVVEQEREFVGKLRPLAPIDRKVKLSDALGTFAVNLRVAIRSAKYHNDATVDIAAFQREADRLDTERIALALNGY